MACLVILVAGLLVVAEAQVSSMADLSNSNGFLSKSDASGSTLGQYNKFITPNLKHMKHGNGADALSHHNNPAVDGLATDDSITFLHDESAHPKAQVYSSIGFPSTKEQSWINPKDFDLVNIADKEGDEAVQKLLTKDNSNMPITLSAIGVALLTLATMIGVRVWRGMQSSSVLASSSTPGFDVSDNLAPGMSENNMEITSQGSDINSAVAFEKTSSHRESSKRVGWGQLSSQISPPLTLCYASNSGSAPAVVGRRPFIAAATMLPLACAATCAPLAADAACLPSDASLECIGVYKDRGSGVTREDAKAIGIRWVEQPSFSNCKKAAAYLRDERKALAQWRSSVRSNADYTVVGRELLGVRPRVQAACATLASNVDTSSAALLNRAAEGALCSMDAADLALGFAIRESDPKWVVSRAADAADALDVADADYCELVRYVNALFPPGEAKKRFA
jgi:hypothetical protein